MASRQISDLDARLQPIAIQFLHECKRRGVNSFIDATYRSREEQDDLYAQGRTVPGMIVTHAPGGQSAHNCTLDDNITPAARAFDIAIYNADGKTLDWKSGDEAWKTAHAIGRMLGLALGADWPKPKTDGPHMEMQNWRDVNVKVGNSGA